MLDLDSARRQRAAAREGSGQPVTVTFADTTYTLPVEVPAAVVQTLLDPDVEFAQLLMVLMKAWRGGSDQAGKSVVNALTERPSLPFGCIKAIQAALEQLFGADEWARFTAAGPSLNDMVTLITGLVSEYGVGLGEALTSPSSSETAGTTSNPTSDATTT